MNKQSNERFNDLINYIEDNLCEEISYKKLAQILGTKIEVKSIEGRGTCFSFRLPINNNTK